jgi:hypothetical protein
VLPRVTPGEEMQPVPEMQSWSPPATEFGLPLARFIRNSVNLIDLDNEFVHKYRVINLICVPFLARLFGLEL